jgi:hypothetical protein
LIGFCIMRRGKKDKQENEEKTPYDTWMANEEAKRKGDVMPQFAGPKANGINLDGQKIEDLHLVFEEDMADVYGDAEGQEEDENNLYDDLYGADTSVPIYDDQEGYADETIYNDGEQFDEMYGGDYDLNDHSTHNPVYDTGGVHAVQNAGAVGDASLMSPSYSEGDKARLADTPSAKSRPSIGGGKKALFNPIRFKAGEGALDKTEAPGPSTMSPKQPPKRSLFNPARFKSNEDSVEEIADTGGRDGQETQTHAPSIPRPIEPLKPLKPSPKAPAQAPVPPVKPVQHNFVPSPAKRPTSFKALVPLKPKEVYKPKAANGEVVAAKEGQFPVRVKAPIAAAPVPAVKARRTTRILDETIKDTDFNL